MTTRERTPDEIAADRPAIDFVRAAAEFSAGIPDRALEANALAIRSDWLRRKRLEEFRQLAEERDVPVSDEIEAVLGDPEEREARLVETPAIRAIRAFETPRIERPSLLVLGGATGSGKSLATIDLLLRHSPARYVDVFSMTLRPRNGWTENEKAWERWREARFLAIDDLGSETPSDRFSTDVGALVLARWAQARATLVSTNLSRAEFASRYFASSPERFADRFRGQRGPWYVDADGPSLRGKRSGS